MARSTATTRYNLFVSIPTYVGDGLDDRKLSNLVTYQPQFVLTKGGANNAFFRTTQMRGDYSFAIAQTAVGAANAIQGICQGGMVVGTDAGANASGTTYYTLMIRGAAAQQYFSLLRYIGNGSDNRNYTGGGFSFTPDLFLVKGETTQGAPFKITSMPGDPCGVIAGSADQANTLQALIANGAQFGTGARANANTVEYFGIAMREFEGIFDQGTYVGTGSAQTISTSFPLDWIVIKNGGATTPAVFKTSAMGATESYRLSATNVSTVTITAFGASGGFTVGTSNDSNQNGNTFWWFGGRAGSFNVPVTRSNAGTRTLI